MTTAVIGLGTMGPGIAATLARGGMTVRCFDTSAEARERAPALIAAAGTVLSALGTPDQGDGAGADQGCQAVFPVMAPAVSFWRACHSLSVHSRDRLTAGSNPHSALKSWAGKEPEESGGPAGPPVQRRYDTVLSSPPSGRSCRLADRHSPTTVAAKETPWPPLQDCL